MPQTTAPIGSLIGKTFGRSARSTRTSACIPSSSEPVTPPNPATRAPSAVAKRITLRVLISSGRPPLPGQLAIEDRGVLHRDRRPHLREQVAGRDPLVVDREARPHVVVDQAAGSAAVREPPAISLDRRDRDRGAGGRDGIDVRRRRAGSRGRRVTSSPRSPRSASSEMVPVRSFGVGVDAQAELPGTRPSPARGSVPGDGPDGRSLPNAIVVDGPARCPQADGPRARRARRPRRRTRCEGRRRRAPAARRRRGRRPAPVEDQSTTVVMPASAAPSNPMRVAA